jgi:hypothetical protein
MRTDDQSQVKTAVISLGRVGRKFVRLDKPFDPGAEAVEPPKPEYGGLIDMLRKAIGSVSRDRRGAFRHDVVARDIWVGWWTGEHFDAVLGQLLNLSRSGAMIVLGYRPPRRQPIWIYKEVGSTLACVRGQLVGLNPAPNGEFSARFRFSSPCPTVLCQSALCGPSDPPARGSILEVE